ncbi:hypothetical protein YC2023_053576 [Brassica napus]
MHHHHNQARDSLMHHHHNQPSHKCQHSHKDQHSHEGQHGHMGQRDGNKPHMHHQAQMRQDGDDGFRDFEVGRDKGRRDSIFGLANVSVFQYFRIYFEVLVL